jgi:cellobiose transport system permease protein
VSVTAESVTARPAAPTSPGRPGRRRRRPEARLAPYLFVAPFFLVFAVFGVFPLLFTAWVSLHDWHIFGSHTFLGVDNYVALWGDPRFLKSLVNTVSIMVLSTGPQLALALVLASLLHGRQLRGRQFFRVGLLAPNITSVVAVGIIFESIFGFNTGVLNTALEGLGLDRINWQSNRFASHVAVATMVNWRWTGYNALLFLAGLQAVPRDLYEAAAMDRAGPWQQLRHITIPMLRPLIVFVALVSVINGLQIFAEPLLFQAGPGVSGGNNNQFLTTTLYLYGQAFREFRFGYAAAIAWTLFVVIVVATLLTTWLTHRIRSAD